ncbi:MAG: hypothetical protein K9J17_14380 [Flavobacteriales bacterium]|nr:hypothetical protein [Flavobacteriales bacterium]
MCQPSATLKLCSCSHKEQKALGDTWEFHPHVLGKAEFIIGTMAGPPPIDPAQEKLNLSVLTQLLNKPETFDVDLQPKTKDRLLLNFKGTKGVHRYGFEYRRGQWRSIDYDPFSWVYEHTHAKTGCLKENH